MSAVSRYELFYSNAPLDFDSHVCHVFDESAWTVFDALCRKYIYVSFYAVHEDGTCVCLRSYSNP